MISFLEVLNRAQSGPVVDPIDWDMKIIAEGVKEKINEHGLNGTYDPENPVNTDDNLVAKFYKAAFEFAIDTGVLCTTTQRVIKFDEKELRQCLLDMPLQSFTWGYGDDAVTVKLRRPDEKSRPTTWYGPMGTPIDEDLWVPIHKSTMQYKCIDALCSGSLTTLHGVTLRAGTPIETLIGIREWELTKNAIKEVNRQGTGVMCPVSGTSEFSWLGAYGLRGSIDGGIQEPTQGYPHTVGQSELKTDYPSLNRVALFQNVGVPSGHSHWSMIGGFAGGPEGAAMVAIAAHILYLPVHQSRRWGLNGIWDMKLSSNTSRMALWASSVSRQAQSIYTNSICGAMVEVAAGPCTDMLLYEQAVSTALITTSGSGVTVGTTSARCQLKNYHTGLEDRFGAEVTEVFSNLKRGDANELAKNLIPKYEQKLPNPPDGKSFTECFNITNLQPSEEWSQIEKRVKKEIRELGIDLS